MANTSEKSHHASETYGRARRQLAFQSLAEIQADIEHLLTANNGQIHTIGQLTPAQNIGHIASFIDCSVHGFPYTFPWYLRLAGKFLQNSALNKPLSAGMMLPPRLVQLMNIHFPPVETPLETAVDALAAAIAAASKPGAMNQKSPLFGQLTEQQWTRLHCLHADLHFSFLY